MSDKDDEISRTITVRTSQRKVTGGIASFTEADLHRGPRRWRRARLTKIYDPDSGDLKNEELRLSTWQVQARIGAVGTEPVNEWFCSNTEIPLLVEFVRSNLTDGSYRLVPNDDPLAGLIDLIAESNLAPTKLSALLERLISVAPQAIDALATTDAGRAIGSAVETDRRRRGLIELEQIVTDDSSTEHDIHRALRGQPWIFGGRYIGEAARRQLTTESSVDIPLIRGDGALHIVELKRANIKKLVVKYRAAGLIVGDDVNEGVGQVQNYLRNLDEERSHIRDKYNVDTRRATATLVIGRADTADFGRSEVLETVRNYNSYLSRIEVLTYDELIASARRLIESE